MENENKELEVEVINEDDIDVVDLEGDNEGSNGGAMLIAAGALVVGGLIYGCKKAYNKASKSQKVMDIRVKQAEKKLQKSQAKLAKLEDMKNQLTAEADEDVYEFEMIDEDIEKEN